ncbi:MAG TPA: oxidoreductase-like domain-containing protein [Rhodanobacteraceae bacterium]|nr:oxidoreductase-like domain-containing protein [Rhodanobacteraceae bacterium]
MADTATDPDPKPRPPEKPLPGDCCESGCDACVYTVYSEELDEYAQRLEAWRKRHPGEQAGD